MVGFEEEKKAKCCALYCTVCSNTGYTKYALTAS